MSTIFDPKAQLYVCIRNLSIVGYGDTPESAAEMADAIERAQQAQAQQVQSIAKPRYRLNPQTMRYEMVTEGNQQ